MSTIFLERIDSPDDLKGLSEKELNMLSAEIRNKLIDTVAQTGGHLASNLGVVELTLALHRVFDFKKDKLIFDVGHQSYVHKLITGRREEFSTLRQYEGISGFPKRGESPYDAFETGHASTAISAALGMARARDAKHLDHAVVALVGDGALTGGMCYEALNDAGNAKTRLLVVLNDNEMSISRNVGALSQYLTKLRVNDRYQKTKKEVKKMRQVPIIGKPVYRLMHGAKAMVKMAFVRDPDVGFFEALGFEYFGPIDGHDIRGLEEVLTEAAKQDGPALIHVKTRKGAGYDQAENRPETFHGTPPFYVETGKRIHTTDIPSMGHVMADKLAEMTDKDPGIMTITAAMPMGTGLDHYKEKHPDHFIDVGIAEEHAATMAAGMAAGGLRPYFAVYSSFFQRCHDQMIHDICLQDLPVVFLLDRAGIGSNDGPTHHGVFDFAQLLPIPGMQVLAPGSAKELEHMLTWTREQDHPCTVRYPRMLPVSNGYKDDFCFGKWNVLQEGTDCSLLCVGSMVHVGNEVRKLLAEQGISAEVVNCSTVKPLDEAMLKNMNKPCFTLEEHMLAGGFGSYVLQTCMEKGYRMPDKCFGIQQGFVTHGDHKKLMEIAGLSAENISKEILRKLKRG